MKNLLVAKLFENCSRLYSYLLKNDFSTSQYNKNLEKKCETHKIFEPIGTFILVNKIVSFFYPFFILNKFIDFSEFM